MLVDLIIFLCTFACFLTVRESQWKITKEIGIQCNLDEELAITDDMVDAFIDLHMKESLESEPYEIIDDYVTIH